MYVVTTQSQLYIQEDQQTVQVCTGYTKLARFQPPSAIPIHALSYLQSLFIETDGLFNVALLPLDVGQVVERVSMIGIHLKSSVVAFLSLGYLQHNSSWTLHSTTWDDSQSYLSLLLECIG